MASNRSSFPSLEIRGPREDHRMPQEEVIKGVGRGGLGGAGCGWPALPADAQKTEGAEPRHPHHGAQGHHELARASGHDAAHAGAPHAAHARRDKRKVRHLGSGMEAWGGGRFEDTGPRKNRHSL